MRFNLAKIIKVFFHRLRHGGFSETELQLYDRIGQAVEAWIRDRGHFRPLPSIEAMAADIGVQPDQLTVYIRLRTGKAPLSWRKDLRIEEAKRLLAEHPALPVSTVAELVGIGDKSNFKRQFTQATQMSPSAWRARHARK